MNRSSPCSFLFATGLVLAGCAVGPSYHPPKDSMPPAYPPTPVAAEPAAATAALTQWWRAFGDEELDSLLARAVANNRDLQQAVSRVREARAERSVAAAGLLPEGELSAGYNRSLGSRNVVLPLGSIAGSSGAGSGGSAAGGGSSGGGSSARHAEGAAPAGGGAQGSAPASGGSQQLGGPQSPFGDGGLPGVTTNLYQAGFDAAWELDVFGGTRRAIEAARAEVGAAEEARRGVMVSLLAEVATGYGDLRMGQQQLDLARRNLRAQQDTLEIVRAKVRQGLANDGEVTRQAGETETTRASLPALEAAERAQEHALAFLLGVEPDALVAELTARRRWSALPPAIPLGVPSDLLRRRPDIRQAERELAAATAEVGVATAGLYPSFSLTGSFGVDSSDLHQLPEWSSRYYSIAPGIHWPILEWNRLHAGIRIQNELQAQALLAYQDAVARALREVADALVRYAKESERRAALARAADDAEHARDLIAGAYRRGLTDQLAVLEAERTVVAVENALAASDGALRTDLIALYKALGGGWDPPS
jgi:multidrug efflux system outer membrane protein